MKIKRVISISAAVLFSFFVCFLSAILANEYLEMNVDFLSSGATLSTALVAVILFNDWRDQHVVKLFEDIKERLYLSFLQLEMDIHKLELFLEDIEKHGGASEFIVFSNAFTKSVEKVLLEMDFYIKLIEKFKISKNKLYISPEHTQEYLLKVVNNLKKYETVPNKEYFLKDVLQGLIKNDCSGEIKKLKTLINDDLQRLVLMLLLDNK